MLRNIVKPVNDVPEVGFEPSRRPRPTLVVAPEALVQPRRRGEATLDLRTDAVVVDLFDHQQENAGQPPKRGSNRSGDATRNDIGSPVLSADVVGPRVERIIETDDSSSVVVTRPIVQIFESATPTRRRLSRTVELLFVALVFGVGAALVGSVLTIDNQGVSSGRTLIETSIGEAFVVERASIDSESTVSAQSGADEPDVTPNGAPAAAEGVGLSSGSAVTDPSSGAVGDGAQVASAP